MRVTELTNLFVGDVNGFTFLICADEHTPYHVAHGYCVEAGLDEHALKLSRFNNPNMVFSCDYVVH